MKLATGNYFAVVMSAVACCLATWAGWRSFQVELDIHQQQTVRANENAVESKVTPSRREAADASILARNLSLEGRATVRLPTTAPPAGKDELESEAKYVAERLLAAMPREPLALHVNAMLNAQLHNTAEAERLWKECIELAPRTEQYYLNLAATALDRGESELAVQTLEKAKSQGLNSPDISHHLSVALANVGRLEEAAQVAEETLRIHPQSAAHWLLLGQAQLKLGKVELAETNLRKAIDLGIHSKSAYFSLFNACTRLGKREDAKKYREIYASFSEKELDSQQRFQVLSEAEARRICISILMEATALFRAANQLHDAEHLLLRVMALDVDYQAACLDLADIYSKQKRYADERIVRERLVELDPLNLLNYLLAAKAAAVSGDPQAAEALIKLAISLSPRSATGYAAMAEFLLEQKQPDKSIWYLQQAQTIAPSPAGLKLLVIALRQAGKEREAQAAEEAIQKTPAASNSPPSN